jgi:CRISPR/Cas system-associated protein Csm6
VKPTKTICFSFDEKVMILAVTGRLYLADTHKGKISYEVVRVSLYRIWMMKLSLTSASIR